MTETVDVLDRGGAPLKHWCHNTDNGKVYMPVPLRADLGKSLKALKTYEPKKDDIWICGYPKSGNHWTFELVNILLSGRAEPYNRMMESSFVEIFDNLDHFNGRPSPRVFHSHLTYEKLPSRVQELCKIIAVIRNPKSTAVSHYHHMVNAWHNDYTGTFHNFWPLYFDGFIDGYLYGDWFNFAKTYWRMSKQKENLTVFFYEDFVKDPLTNLTKLCNFLGIERTDEFKKEVIKLTTIDKLIETWSQKHPDDLKFTEQLKSTLIYRNGKIEDWKNHFSVADNDLFNSMYRDKMADVPDLAAKIQFE